MLLENVAKGQECNMYDFSGICSYNELSLVEEEILKLKTSHLKLDVGDHVSRI
jgi:hypothetical protein